MRLTMLLSAFALTVLSLSTVTNAELCDPIPGVRQSPVNIDVPKLVLQVASPLRWSNDYKIPPHSFTLVDDGHSLKLQANYSSLPTLSRGQLPVPYQFQQLHFHWGVDNSKGSEHRVNNGTLPLEMHVVHTQESSDKADQYVVVSYFFRLGRANKGLSHLLEAALVAAGNKTQPVDLKPFSLADLVHTRSFSYYTYKGSLTTPPYTESVTWVISATPLTISQAQLDILRQAGDIDHHLKDNFRCLQELNGRKIGYVIQLPI